MLQLFYKNINKGALIYYEKDTFFNNINSMSTYTFWL